MAPWPTASSPKRILVVDDNHDGATSLARLLQRLGHEVTLAHDGLGAVERAEAFRPDAILLDVGLPDVDGREVARRIRAEPWGRHTLLIAATGWGNADERRRSIEAGFDHHLVKPMDLTELRTLIEGDPRG